MQTQLIDLIRQTPEGREADAILRSCVHCGFCLATCPTYQLLGDENDGPRGRIYLIKSMLEGNEVTRYTQRHLDRCLTCRSCETTCPSGVNYHRLLDIGRAEVDKRVTRPWRQRLVRKLLLWCLPDRRIFTPLIRVGQWLRPLMPRAIKEKIPPRERHLKSRPHPRWPRAVMMLEGCVQPGMAPSINIAARRVLDCLGISVRETPRAGCCGALRFHLGELQGAQRDMRNNIDVWIEGLDEGVEAIAVTASGCGAQIKSYVEVFGEDGQYSEKAARVVARSLDIAELICAEKETLLDKLQSRPGAGGRAVAFHSPCTLQHGLRIIGVVETLLEAAGYQLVAVGDSHLCCGSAGTYSILEPALAVQLRDRKLASLCRRQPEVIATANIGCLTHMQTAASVPVKHWIELIEEVLCP